MVVKSIDRYCSHSEYVEFSHSNIDLLTLKCLIKGVIENLGMDSEKLNFVSISTVYEDNNGDIVAGKNPITTSTSEQISVKHNWIR